MGFIDRNRKTSVGRPLFEKVLEILFEVHVLNRRNLPLQFYI